MTTASLGVVLVAGVIALVVHRNLSTVGIALAGLGIYAALCVMPMGTMDRSMSVPSLFAGLLIGISAAIGGFVLTVLTWSGIGAGCLAAAVAGSCAAWVLLGRMRRGPDWQAADNTDIGYWAEGRRR